MIMMVWLHLQCLGLRSSQLLWRFKYKNVEKIILFVEFFWSEQARFDGSTSVSVFISSQIFQMLHL